MSGRLTGRDGGDLLKAWRAETTLHGLHGEREASPFCRRRWDHSLLMVELMALWPPAHLLILTGYRNRLPNWSCACTSPEGERFLLGWSVDWRFPKVMEWRKYKEAIAESREAAFFFRLRVNHKFNFPVLLRLEGCNIPQGGKDALWQSSGSSAVGGCWYLYVLILGTPMWIYS